MSANAVTIANKFFRLARLAAKHGGFWVSAGGGTARVVAGEIARATGTSFEDALRILERQGDVAVYLYGPEHYGWAGNFDWYVWLADIQPHNDPECARFDARTIALAACRGVAA
jgi:hypothetical protein